MFVTGDQIDHYRILEKLGEGGMGMVYEAEDTRLSRRVALKLLSPHIRSNVQAKERFMREARAASALDHPNICTVHEINETPDRQLYIVMARYRGETLDRTIEREPIDFEKSCAIASQIALGLATASRRGIVHQDLKPANIFLTDDGMVKILDFGLAKLAGDSSPIDRQNWAGTVPYMSPEQVRGENTDTRADIWSFGVVLYEMLTGSLPFSDCHHQAVVYSILNEEPQPLNQRNPAIPEQLCQLVEKCLKKDPARRYQNFDELFAELSPDRRLRRVLASLRDVPAQISRLRWMVAGVVLLAALGLAAFFHLAGSPEGLNAHDQSVVVTGRVVDPAHAPVPGASVTIISVHFQTFTRDDGSFLGVVSGRSIGEKLVLVISHTKHQTRKLDFIVNTSKEDFGEILLKN